VALRTPSPTTSQTADARLFVSQDGAVWVPWDGNSRASVRWYALHRPSATTQASVSVPAPGVGYALICDSLTVTLVGDTSAPSAVTVNVSLINGATGGSSYLWGTKLGLAAVAGATTGVTPANGPWQASENTALTLEFAAGAGSNTLESVTMAGRIIPV
jgi:hypothetical protein